MKFCIFHDWSKWSEPFNTHSSYRILQSRVCNNCGKIHAQEIKQPWAVWFSASILNTK